MNILLLKESFLKASALTSQVINPRPSLPILGTFLLNAEPGYLEITATNLETTIKYKIPVKVIEKGNAAVPARALIEFCQAINSEKVGLVVEKEKALLSCENANAAIPTMIASEFPSIDKFEQPAKFIIKREKLLEAVSQVAFSAAPEEGRPILTGVLITEEDGRVKFVATDGYRLSVKETHLRGEIKLVLPSRALREASKAVAEQEDDEVTMAVNKDKNLARLETKNLIVTSRILEGEYPDYKQIIPNAFITELVINTKEFLDSVKLAALFAKDIGNVIKLNIKENAVLVSASTAQVGEASAQIRIKHKGEEIKTAFNSRFILDALATIKGQETVMKFSGVTSASIIKGVGEESLTHIVMPVRIQT